MSKSNPNINVGDLVYVLEGTNDIHMPANRCGVVGEKIIDPLYVERTPPPPARATFAYKLYMTNGHTLKFHEMSVQKIEGE